MLSVGGRLVLINSVLTSLAMYMLSFFEIPKGVLKKLNYYRSRFYWQCDEHKKKYRLTKWSILCRPIDCGGLGIQNLETQNKCLLSKWLFKLINEEGIWQNLLRRKYLSHKNLAQAQRQPGDSHFWSGLMKVKDQFLHYGRFKVHNGKETRFWEDNWVGDRRLKIAYPNLYQIVRKKSATVAEVLSTTPLNVTFRRALTGVNLESWYKLVACVLNTSLTGDRDIFIWNLHKSGVFSTRSFYRVLICDGIVPLKSPIWKIKIPLKIKIFLWYIKNGVTLTKDNLAKRDWKGNLKCCSCSSLETIEHLFIQCHFARFIWNTIHITFGIQPPSSTHDLFGSWLAGFRRAFRNQICVGFSAICWAIWLNRNDMVFNCAKANTFMQVIFRATYWARSWSLLLRDEDARTDLNRACRLLESVVMEVFAKFGWKFSNRIAA